MVEGCWNYIVDEPRRSELLRQLGISEPVVRLGNGGALPHPVFEFHCRTPHRSSDDQWATFPLVIALYETLGGICYAVRKVEQGLEFVSFDSEEPSALEVLGSSEQAVLADLVLELLGSGEHTDEAVRDGAAALGFSHFDACLAFLNRESQNEDGYEEQRVAFTRTL